ncbi:hypothetical protein CBS147332_1283 [Penicillium roqueforti]|nr:hypothetical protein CBS147332_1283 [Penicillium roqueforti]KAI3122844.1 hypothetical protein CBS147331_1294 [Penicillium roqueforti]
MAPIPGMTGEPARFENHYSKLENSHGLQGWPLLPVFTASILIALIVVGIVAHVCFWGRDSHPQAASSEDKMKMENTKETCSDGWMCFILACHAVITLGVV